LAAVVRTAPSFPAGGEAVGVAKVAAVRALVPINEGPTVAQTDEIVVEAVKAG